MCFLYPFGRLFSSTIGSRHDVGTPDYPPLDLFPAYLEGYCDNFALHAHIKLRHAVTSVGRNEDNSKWAISYVDPLGKQQMSLFDKVIMASGANAKVLIPKTITGLEKFNGRVLHSQAFKRCVFLFRVETCP